LFNIECSFATLPLQIVKENNLSFLVKETNVDNISARKYLDASNVPGTLHVIVKVHRFQTGKLDGQGIGYSKEMNLSGYLNFHVTIKIIAEGKLTNSEYAEIYHEFNESSEILLDQLTNDFFELPNQINQF
jgi:hypothetical protein